MPEKPSSAGSDAVVTAFCACPDQEVAAKISAAVVESGLAACVNQFNGVVSTFRWKGKLCREQEYLLMIKTIAASLGELERCIARLHPYELPEFIAVPCTAGSEPYLQWVATNSKPN